MFFIFVISSCSTLNNLKDSYQKFLPNYQTSIYVVQPGDSLWSIALKLNIDQKVLIARNNLSKPYVIYPKQRLLISGGENIDYPLENDPSQQWLHPLNNDFQPSSFNDEWIVFKQPRGTPIFSIDSGKVEVAGPDIPGYGNIVMISHSKNYLSLYAHCDKIFVEQGDEVYRGSKVAQLGSTESPFPLLKFQLRRDGKPVKPENINFIF
jgi:murein DD-endopeptidase MepM/ murein hydrolase activator NlpD